jgi:hypothetical protein
MPPTLPADEYKAVIYDEINCVLHDTVVAWGLIRQNDPDEALLLIESIKGRLNTVEQMMYQRSSKSFLR